MRFIHLKKVFDAFKGTVRRQESHCNDGNVRFTKIPFKT